MTESSKRDSVSKSQRKSLAVSLNTKRASSDKVLIHLRSIRDEAFRGKHAVDESSESSCSSRMVLHPDSVQRIGWDILAMFIIIYQSLEVPFRLCFDVPLTGNWVIFDFVITLVFTIDIIICFNTGSYHSGTLVVHRPTIMKGYFFGWFWVDFISTLPLNWFITGVFSNQPSNDQAESNSSLYNSAKLLRAVKIFQFLRILKLLRLTKLKRILIKIEDYIASSTLATTFVFIRLLSLVFFIAHWTACWWYFIGNQDMYNNPVTWVVAAKITDSSTFDKYVTSLYWAFTTMTTVGYGDITPFTMNEKIFAILTMILACGIFAYTVGSIGSLVSKQNSGENAYREQVVAVNRYMRKKQLPYDLQFRVRRYLEYVWENRKKNNMDEKQILNLLSEPLRDEIYAHIHGIVIKMCVIFTIYEDHFISQLTKTLESETYAPGDVIIEEGEMSTKMYFIQNGKIDIYHQTTKSTIAELGTKKYFGEIAFFLETPRCASAKCIDFVDLLSLSRTNLNILLDKFPEAKIATETLAQKCMDEDYSCLSVACYVCQASGHVAIRCNKILLNLDHDDAKKKWLEGRKERYSCNVDLSMLEPSNYSRVPRNLLKPTRRPMNVLGLAKTTSKLFKEEGGLEPAVSEYLNMMDGVKNVQDLEAAGSFEISDQDKTAIEDEQKLAQKYSMIYRDSEGSGSESDSQDYEEEEEQEDEDKQIRVTQRQFRNSLLVPGMQLPRRDSNTLNKIQEQKSVEKKLQHRMFYNPTNNLEMLTPYNTIDDDGYEAEIDNAI